jgi:hypothetical protein
VGVHWQCSEGFAGTMCVVGVSLLAMWRGVKAERPGADDCGCEVHTGRAAGINTLVCC